MDNSNNTPKKPECYIILEAFRDRYIPATVVRETAATITVQPQDPEKRCVNEMTFQKVKVYGKNEYRDPRELQRTGLEQFQIYNNNIYLRGARNDFRPTRLTFAVDAVQQRIAQWEAQDLIKQKCHVFYDMVAELFDGTHSHPRGATQEMKDEVMAFVDHVGPRVRELKDKVIASYKQSS